jgi:hypothetical protein
LIADKNGSLPNELSPSVTITNSTLHAQLVWISANDNMISMDKNSKLDATATGNVTGPGFDWDN